MEGSRCVVSSSSSGSTHGLLNRCIYTAADHIHDFVNIVFFDRVSDIVSD